MKYIHQIDSILQINHIYQHFSYIKLKYYKFY